ncbi:diguanylate cyclase [uncultured Clostridium sp.]|uniref:diguanylate cyclase n=1 Tax=uncultured Clostridium sp. TaxID=59620 RepID=UPI0025D31BB8|nr:diguanylate cyclase [uncultured Clostridium sp.]
MRSINNRYFIEQEVCNEENYCKYIVKECESDKKYVFVILKNDFTYEKTREYLLGKFKTIKNLNCQNVINLLKIEIIYNMDGIKLDKYQYGYLMEYLDTNINTQAYLKKCSSKEKLDIFMELCSIINTLNAKGYIFKDILYKDILLFKEKDKKVHVKIDNILQNEISKLSLINISKTELPYPYNIENSDEAVISKDNVSELVEFFSRIFKDKELESNLKELKDIKKRFNQVHTINKSYNLNHFIKYVNNTLNEHYDYFLSETLNVIENDIDIIGREEEIKIVEKNYKNMLESKIKYKIIAFNGDNGSGKTRILNEIKYILENKYFRSIIYIDDLICESNEKTYEKIIEYIKKNCDKQIYDKYDIYIRKFISICIESENNKISEDENNQQLQFINRVGKFIREYTSSNPLVLMIDDLEKKNKVLREFIRYISFFGNSLENIIIIFSLNENNCDEEFLNYVNELKTLDQYEEYKLNLLNQYDTTKIIKRILNTNKPVRELATKIYSETLGNPQYILQVIEELYNNNILYFDEEKVRWKTRIRVKDILIPKTLEEKLETYMSFLNEDEINVLRLLSIYEIPLPEKLILTNIITDISDIQIYRNLKIKGFLIDKISDLGMLVGFSNNLLRNILYLKLDKEKKKAMHKKAAELLKETLSTTDYYIEEIIFHFEECGDFTSLCYYALNYAEYLDENGNYEKAIVYLKKVLKNSKNDHINSSIKIAKIQEKMSDHKKSYEYFDKARKYAIEEHNEKMKVYSMLRMIEIEINSSVYISPEIEEKLNMIKDEVTELGEPREEAYYHYALSLKYRSQFEHELSENSAIKAIEICRNNNIKEDVYAWSMVTLGTVYLKNSRFDAAKELFVQSLELFTKNKNNNGIIISRLMTTSINMEQGYSVHDVVNDYYEIERLSKKLKLYKRTILALLYIVELYIDEEEYEKAEQSLMKALNIEREEGIDFYSIKICTNLCIVYLNLGKLKLAIKYYSLINQMQKVVLLLEDDVINIYKTDALFNAFICNDLKAFECLDKVNEKSGSYYNKITMCMYLQLKLYTCIDEEGIRTVYHQLLAKLDEIKNEKTKLKIRVSAVKTVLDLGYYEIAKEFFYEIKDYPKEFNTEGVYIYLEFKFRNKNSYNFLINKALRLCTVISNKKICAELYGVIAEKYEELGCYILALNNFYESIVLHIDIINLLSEHDKIIYANNGGFLKIRNMLIACFKEKLSYNINCRNVDRIQCVEELNKSINEISIQEVLSDKSMYNLMQESYEKCYYNDLSSIFKVFDTFSSNIVENMENIMKYMARITLADKALLAVENNDGENNIICTYRLNDKNEIDRYFSLKLDSEEDVIVISNNENRFDQLDNEVLKDGIRSCIYMKLRNRERRINSESSVNGQLILISTNAVNYINSESKKIIKSFKPFLTFLLEKYNLTISSTLDKLTSVYNRKYFEESLIFLLEGSRLDNSEFAVIMFDIDDFKGVNDKYGHQVGDEVLIKVTREVQKSISKNDIIGRYGGEEFIVLLPNCDKNKAINVAEKIRTNVDDARILGEKRKVTISIGIAMSNNERISSEEIVKRADQALYRAKHEGKNRCILWDGESGISSNTNTSSELSGVLTGNATKDYNFMSIIKDVASIVKSRADREHKMYEFVLKIMQIIECENVALFIIKNGKIVNILSKDCLKDGWNISEKFNFKLVYKTIEDKKGMYQVDWDNMGKQDKYGIPDWKSVCITPVICKDEILALIYVSVSVNNKEFTEAELNQLNFFADIGIPIFN